MAKSESPRKLHHLIRKDDANTTSTRLKIATLVTTILLTMMNVTSILLLKLRPSDSYQKQVPNNEELESRTLVYGYPLYLSTGILSICLAKYTYQSIMFRLTSNSSYNTRKIFLLNIANTFTSVIQVLYLCLVVLLRCIYSDRLPRLLSSESDIGAVVSASFIVISTTLALVNAVILWRKVYINDRKILLLHTSSLHEGTHPAMHFNFTAGQERGVSPNTVHTCSDTSSIPVMPHKLYKSQTEDDIIDQMYDITIKD